MRAFKFIFVQFGAQRVANNDWFAQELFNAILRFRKTTCLRNCHQLHNNKSLVTEKAIVLSQFDVISIRFYDNVSNPMEPNLW